MEWSVCFYDVDWFAVGKHPISALVELCNKKKWGPPDFIVVNESGPDHKKHFIIKASGGGWEPMCMETAYRCGTGKTIY